MAQKKYAAIVLSAGRGTRMKSSVPKQYLMLEEKPVLAYSLLAFEESIIEEIIVVTGEEDITYCQEEIVSLYGIHKVKAVIAGGKERYHSVFCGLQQLQREDNPPDYVLIHDGARPFLDNAIIKRCTEGVEAFQACVVGMLVKDTIKMADEELFATATLPRKDVWMVQTPQAFQFSIIYHAYETLLEWEHQGKELSVTDDAMVVEQVGGHRIKMIEGSYRNIKITTPEDLEIAKVFAAQNRTIYDDMKKM
ncbi:MAG: 2-C-methyl-D-erythritol 4-phosphate cytidylyltransferase [Lachnospiraceae bacterium]